MTTNQFILLALAPLALVLIMAAWQDMRENRVSNRVALTGAALGILFNALFPQGSGFLSAFPGGVGLSGGLEGLALGFALLFPFCWLGMIGAGDVKLLAAVGAFLGPWDIFGATLSIFLAGGLLGLVLAAGRLSGLLSSLKSGLTGTLALNKSVGTLPYAVAIAMGTAAYAAWRLGF